MALIIDVSHHNSDKGAVNWPEVAKTAHGAYVKTSEGATYVDPACDMLYAGARAAGLPVGPYHFADLGNPVIEANHFADRVQRRAWQLAPTADIEKAGATPEWAKAFRTQFRVRMGGTQWSRRFRVYLPYFMMRAGMNPDLWIDADTTLWVARYNSTLGMTQAEFDRWHAVLWQNTATATVPGFVGSVDEDQYLNGWTPAVDTTGGLMAAANAWQEPITDENTAGGLMGHYPANTNQLINNAKFGLAALGAQMATMAANQTKIAAAVNADLALDQQNTSVLATMATNIAALSQGGITQDDKTEIANDILAGVQKLMPAGWTFSGTITPPSTPTV